MESVFFILYLQEMNQKLEEKLRNEIQKENDVRRKEKEKDEKEEKGEKEEEEEEQEK